MKYAFLLTVLLSGLVLAACNPFRRNNPEVSPTPTAAASPTSDQPTTTVTPLPSATTSPQGEVHLEQPVAHATVNSPFEIEGSAPGLWFFEGQILGEIKNAANESLAVFPLQASSEWMTEGRVEFSGSATFSKSKAGTDITLIIKNDNPSGLPENEKSASFPLKVAQ